MLFAVLLFTLAATHAVPTGGPTNTNPVTGDKKDGPDLVYTVKRFNFALPSKPFYEERYSNDGIYFVRFPQYTVSIHHRCPFELVASQFLVERMTDKAKCLTVADLTYWSKDDGKDILLDSYKIEQEELSKKNPIHSVTVYKAPEGKVHYVSLAMTDRTCRLMTYTVTPALKVDTQNVVVDCTVVEKLDKENSEWVARQKAADKLAAAAKLLEEAKAKEAKEKEAKEKEAKAAAAMHEPIVKPPGNGRT